MSYELTAVFDPSTAPTTDPNYQSWRDGQTVVLPDREQSYQLQEATETRPEHYRCSLHLSDGTDPSTAAQSLADTYLNTDWLRVSTRRTDDEYREDTYREDPTYYPPELTSGIRTPVNIDRSGLFEINVGRVNYLIDGAEHTATNEFPTVEPTTDSRRRDVISATSNGVEYVTGSESSNPNTPTFNGVKLVELEVHPGKVVMIDAAELDTPTPTDRTVAVERGTVPTGI